MYDVDKTVPAGDLAPLGAGGTVMNRFRCI